MIYRLATSCCATLAAVSSIVNWTSDAGLSVTNSDTFVVILLAWIYRKLKQLTKS